MKKISSPNAFKTCYIADIKEKLGFSVKVAPNRKGESRKITCPDFHARFISEAIRKLQREGKKITYKNIQKVAFELYKKNMSKNKVDKYMGSIKVNNKFDTREIENIVNSEVFELEA